MRLPLLCFTLLLPSARVQAQDSSGTDHAHMDHAAHHRAMAQDSSYAALQERGAVFMGVDQAKSVHRFDALSDGGRIELQSSTGDSADVAAIRHHFQTPFAVHAEKVPGTDVMQAKRDRIGYQLVNLPRGAALRLTSTDAEALRAIHDFMAYQRREHRAGGQE